MPDVRIWPRFADWVEAKSVDRRFQTRVMYVALTVVCVEIAWVAWVKLG